MTVGFLISFTTDLLENDNLLCFGIVLENCSLHYCALYVRNTDFHITLVVDEEYLIEFYGLVFLRCKAIDENLCTSLYLELLACNVYDCVQYYTNLLSFGCKRPQCMRIFPELDSHLIFKTANLVFFLYSAKLFAKFASYNCLLSN